MRKMNRLSLALMVAPVLFSGCMQEKVANVSPSKLKQSNLAIHSKQTTEANSTNNELYTLTSLDSSESTQTTEANSINNELYTLTSLDSSESTIIDEYTLDETDEHISELGMDSAEVNSTLDTLLELSQAMDIHNSTQKEQAANKDWKELTKEDEIIATAVAYLDTKYVWAASGPSAFDCSGFTKYVFKENGMTLPRYSGNQAKIGTKVSFDQLRKGDLVFFDTETKYTQKVNHVGIYMGEGKFIHASSAKKKVIITSFEKKAFYKDRFLWGQRIVETEHQHYTSL